MPTKLWAQFCGGAYRTRSPVIDAEACENLFFETTESSANPKRGVLYGTPGLVPFLTVSDTGCRGIFEQDGRTFAVIGGSLYEIDVVNAIATLLGTVANDGLPVWMASNSSGGNQLAISTAGALYIFTLTTNTLSGPIAGSWTHAIRTLVYMNGYFLLLESQSLRVWFSALEDGTSWPGLNFFARSNTSDQLVGMVVSHDQLWVFGSVSGEVYYVSTDPLNPFLPYPGSLIHDGLVSPFAIGILDEAVVWLSQNVAGASHMLSAVSYTPAEISKPNISVALATYATTADAELAIYDQEGHSFAIWTLPTADVSWAYDAREQEWHQRLTWDSALGVSHKWRVRGLTFVGHQTILAGDWTTGNLYTLSLDRFDENGATVRSLRRAPYLGTENQWVFLEEIELAIQAGIGLATGAGSAPLAMLRISRDSAQTWGQVRTASLTKMGRYLDRVKWRVYTRVRLDRLVLEVAITDAVRRVMGPGLWLRVSESDGQL